MTRMELPMRMAHGTLRRGFSISSPMADAHSMALKAKKTLDQKTALSSDQWGTMLARVKWVAGPKRHHETPAINMRMLSGRMLPKAPMLFTHRAMSMPTMLSRVIAVSQNAAKAM